jgi:RNA polymerase sigma factor (sigma-70 family)
VTVAADREAPDPRLLIARRRLLEDYGRGCGRGRALRAQLAEQFSDHPDEEIEDAVQNALRSFLDEANEITDPGSAFAWIRTAAYRAMLRELRTQGRALSLDPGEGGIEGAAFRDDGPGPAEELIDLEDSAELEVLIREVAASLSDQRREILTLWATGMKKPEIAAELGTTERTVKRGLEDVMRQAREVLARRAGGGCDEGESLVLRFACGLAEAGEAVRARAHMERCGKCSVFAEQMETWREKAGAMLGPAAIEVAHPGLIGRAVDRAGSAISSAKRHVFDGVAQVKQQAAAGFTRSPDPTPLAGVRPGAVAAVVASCIAVGTGAATYCAQQGVDPLSVATGLIAGEEEDEPAPPEKEAKPQAPVVSAEPPAEVVTEPVYQPAEEVTTPTGEAPAEKESTSPKSEEKAEPEPEPTPEVTPPPEASFEPSSPDYTAVESSSSESSSSSTSGSSEAASETEASRATAVKANEAPQFGGP